MDPFDEFQFKPLTEGLGFRKKPASLKEQVKSAGLADEHLQELPTSIPRMSEDLVAKKPMTFDDVIGSLEKTPFKSAMQNKGFLEITEPLPRANREMPIKTMEVELPRTPIQSPFPTQDIFRQPAPAVKKTPSQKELAGVGTRRGAADSPLGRLIPTSTSVPSAALDLVVIVAIALLFTAAMLSVLKMDLGFVMHAGETDGWTMASLIVMFLAIMQMYVIISRTFFGRTLGEWTFDVQLGREEDQKAAYYPVKVVARSLLVTMTGLVLLPFLSLILGSDLAGKMTGVQLYQQRI